MIAAALALVLQAHTLENITPADLPQDSIAGIRLGEPQAAAITRLHEMGDHVEERAVDNGATEYVAGVLQVRTCRGVVDFVTLQLEDFHMFATLAEAMIHVYGPPNTPDIMAMGDPQHAATVSLAAVRLSWRRAPAYLLGYSEVSGERHAFETLAAPHSPCPPTYN